ncbi:hypothetical protein [Bacillus pumilus]|uniref:Uncharacterized protein n=1 Tax=Bacillus pumilus TaxID=1408 RepID=A0AAD0MLP6_BACPU|nr:hypothetical protein [Bacillus pumilus]AVM24238.1 hypothetical protein C5695_10455 [Bacillus pumilus]TYS42851.1 hypothetical protein FZC68_10625 [Bacillus pumilus]
MSESEIIIANFKKSVEEFRIKLASGREAHPEKFIKYLATEIQALNNLKEAYQEGMNIINADLKKLGTGR